MMTCGRPNFENLPGFIEIRTIVREPTYSYISFSSDESLQMVHHLILCYW